MNRNHGWFVTLLTILAGAAMFVGMCLKEGLFSLTDQKEIFSALCNSFFVPGIILSALGLLMLVANGGFFDIMSYGAHSLLVLFTPFRKPEKHEHYFEYKLRKEAKRKKYRPKMLWVGLGMIALATVCLVLYMQCG